MVNYRMRTRSPPGSSVIFEVTVRSWAIPAAVNPPKLAVTVSIIVRSNHMTLPKFYQDYAVKFTKDINQKVKVDVTKNFVSTAVVIGNVGEASADAKAFGYDSLAETLTLTYAISGGGSGAFSESTSAVNGPLFYHYNGG
jgi:hypothetical protein